MRYNFAESALGMAAAPDSFRVTHCFSALVKRSAPQVKGFSEAPEYKSCTRITRTSDSSEVTPSNWSRLALNRKKLKNHVRGGVLPNIRKDMWLGVLGVSDADSVLLAKAFGEPDDAEQITRGVSKYFGLPFDLDYIAPFYVIPAFSTGIDRVLSALKHSLEEKQFDAAPLVPILATLMLHFLEEWEVFAGLSHLVYRQGWVDHTHSQLATSSNMLLSLLNTHMKSTSHALQRFKPVSMSMDTFLKQLVERWYTWPFYLQPFWITVRVVDMYLVEGPKVLYRLALSALKIYSIHGAVSEDTPLHSHVSVLLCTLSPEEKTQWFHDAFNIQLASWSKLLSSWNGYLTAVKRSSFAEHDGVSQSYDGTGQSYNEARGTYQRTITTDKDSEVLDDDSWPLVWGWLPDWITTESPECVFRSSRDGYNLRTLYRKCEEFPNTLLLVRTTKGEVFGAFIATELQERHSKSAQFFGTGETMLFRVKPQPQCFQWTGENDFILRCNDQEMIVGSGGGSFGLWLDGELDKGSSSRCTAFNNSPLTGRDEPHSQFVCAAVEVYNCD